MNKYEFIPGDEITIAPGRTVKRIRALVAIEAFGVAPGDFGGYVEKDVNLSNDYGNAWVSGDAQVYGNARVYGRDNLLLVGPIGSRFATLTVHSDSTLGVRFTTGCFSGSRDEFEAAITATHGDNDHGNAYAAALLLADLIVKPAKVTK
jgi:hypothetical protein